MHTWIKKLFVLFCLLAFCWCGSATAAAADLPKNAGQAQDAVEATDEPEDGVQPEPDMEPETTPDSDTATEEPDTPEEEETGSYTVTLADRVIGAGEVLSFTTISSSFAGGPEVEGYYPGELTVELTGQIVVEAGGRLDIGTLSIGGEEARPVITGTGQIIVKAGGQLRLTCAVLEYQGQGPMIIQETGGSVELNATTVEEGLVQWSEPLVSNSGDSPDDVWLEVGTVLTDDLLPASMETAVQKEGQEDSVEVLLSWDLSGYDGRTDGEVVLSGTFLDETGQPLPSLRPLELTVHWYTPGTLVVTDAQWKGATVPTVQLVVQELPEYAKVWGEVSTDGGVTWSRWEDEDLFSVVEVEPEGWACIFSVSDETSGLFRVAAETRQADQYDFWRSEAFSLSAPEDSEDSEGNRGGSTTPDAPDREPEYAARPDHSEEPEQQPDMPEPEATEPEPSVPPEDAVEEEPQEQEQTQTKEEALTPEVSQVHGQHLSERVPSKPQYLPVPDSGREEERLPSEITEEQTAQKSSQEESVLEVNAQAGGTDEDVPEEKPASEPERPAPAVEEVLTEPAADGAPQAALSIPVQLLLAAAGLAVCVGGAAIVVRTMQKKK